MYLVKDIQNALSGLFLFVVVISPAVYDSREAAWWRALVQHHLPGGIPSRGGPFLDVTMTGHSAGTKWARSRDAKWYSSAR